MKTLNCVHRVVLTLSGGRFGWTLGSMPVVELHHTGRTSGREYRTLLTSPIQQDGAYVLVASKGGDDRDPDWYLNLAADPDVELTVDGETVPVTARTASAEEKAELWPQIVDRYRGYGSYQESTSRERLSRELLM